VTPATDRAEVEMGDTGAISDIDGGQQVVAPAAT
jgi:hypothetical protein